jgi:hypothetical protein
LRSPTGNHKHGEQELLALPRRSLTGIDSPGLPVIESVKVLDKLEPTRSRASFRELNPEPVTQDFAFRGRHFTTNFLPGRSHQKPWQLDDTKAVSASW